MGNCSEIGVPDLPPPPHWGISLLFVDNENNHNDSLDGPRDGNETHAGLEIRSAPAFLTGVSVHVFVPSPSFLFSVGFRFKKSFCQPDFGNRS